MDRTITNGPDDRAARRARDSVPSREFGDYELLDEIGRGGMGVVYRARHKRLDRVVALKLVLSGAFASPDELRRFSIEARAAAGLSHPNIVKIFDTGEFAGQPYIAMEYVRGRSLAAVLVEERPRIRDAALIVRSVAGALEHLHRGGILHRDLKPANILLDEAGRPYVTDFGLAKAIGEASITRTGAVAGTPCYMSPEQAAGRLPDVGARSDVYSLGAILYELLTGRPPALAETPMDTLVQVLEQDPPPPRALNRRVPRELEWICLRCLAKSPQGRYPSAASLGEDLDRFLAGEPVFARPPGPVRRLALWARREPPLALHLTGMALFYAMELANYHVFRTIPLDWHRRVSLVLLVWALASLACQRALKRERWETVGILAWGTVDIVGATAILLLADGAASPLIVIYPLLVVASGLWLRVGVVAFTTAAAVASYLLLVADYLVRRIELQSIVRPGADRPVYFVLALLLVGAAVAYQVGRARALSRFYASRRPPWLRRAD